MLISPEAIITALFFKFHRRLPNLTCPKTLSEKIQFRKLYDRDPRLPRLADKIRVKDHVAGILGREWVLPTIWSGSTLPQRTERRWSIPYVLKANHGSGWNLFVRSLKDQNWDVMEEAAAAWLCKTYGQDALEWLYTQIEPQLLVEPYVGLLNGDLPIDYKFLVFHGRASYIDVITNRRHGERSSIYSRDWVQQQARWEAASMTVPPPVPRPHSFDKMLWAAERLGRDFSFVRVDLYEVNEEPFFGEMTFYPTSGFYPFDPESFDLLLGTFWHYPAP